MTIKGQIQARLSHTAVVCHVGYCLFKWTPDAAGLNRYVGYAGAISDAMGPLKDE